MYVKNENRGLGAYSQSVSTRPLVWQRMPTQTLTLPAGTAVNVELFYLGPGAGERGTGWEWGSGTLLRPLRVRRLPDGSYVALEYGRIQVVLNVQPGRRLSWTPAAAW